MVAHAQGLLQGLNLTGSSEWSQIRQQLEDMDRLPVLLTEVRLPLGPHESGPCWAWEERGQQLPACLCCRPACLPACLVSC